MKDRKMERANKVLYITKEEEEEGGRRGRRRSLLYYPAMNQSLSNNWEI
jgi:hypothetical protein